MARRVRSDALAAALVSTLVVTLVACTSGSWRVAPLRRSTAIELEVVPRPLYATPIFSPSGRSRAAVLLHVVLRNRGAQPVQIESLEVEAWAAGSRLFVERIEGAWLDRLRRVTGGAGSAGDAIVSRRTHGRAQRGSAEIGLAPLSAETLVVELWPRGMRPAPDMLRLSAYPREGRAASSTATVHIYRQHTRLRLPFEGRWQVLAGHHADEPHGRGYPSSQSFAYDLVVLAANGLTYAGDPRRRSSYAAWGRPVLAVADGVVVGLHDGVPENEVVGQRPDDKTWRAQPREMAGNYVVLRHGEARWHEYSAYFHLQPGLALRLGQHVRAGEPIGRCGNSGNSIEPHLHVQLQDGPDPLHAQGLPASFGDLTVYYGHLPVYVSEQRPQPLPGYLPLQPGFAPLRQHESNSMKVSGGY